MMDDGLAFEDYGLQEHPDVTKARLRASGDWEQADRLIRSERTAQYHKTRRERGPGPFDENEAVRASKAAWDLVHERFPPGPEAVPLASLAEYIKGKRRARDKTRSRPPSAQAIERFEEIEGSHDHAVEVIWVYNHLDDQQASALEAPSRGAWTMLAEARQNKSWFYQQMYRPVAQQLSKQQSSAEEGGYKPSKLETMAVAELEKMIKEAVKESQRA